MWRSHRRQGVGTRDGVHVIRAVRRWLPSFYYAATDIAGRCCSHCSNSVQGHGSQLKKPFRAVGTEPMKRDELSSGSALSSWVSLTEEKAGIISAWVPDVLGYHLPLSMRAQSKPASRASPTGASGSTPSPDADACATEHQECPEVPRASKRTRAACPVGGGNRGGGSVGPPFCGPLPNFATSPVFEWDEGLWQWRPVTITSVADASQHQQTPTAAASLSSSESGHFSHDGAHSSANISKALHGERPPARLKEYFLVPFLLCPTLKVQAMQPLMHDKLRDELAAAHNTYHNCSGNYNPDDRGTRRHPTCPARKTPRRSISMPTPVGDLAIWTTQYSDADEKVRQGTTVELPSCAMMENQPPMRVEERVTDRLGLGETRPAAETWEAAKAALRSDPSTSASDATSHYLHVFSSDMNTGRRDSPLLRVGGSLLKSPTPLRDFPHPTLDSMRRNVVGGGLAELILAVDLYAALIARGDLSLSSACWAMLCDTKSWQVVQRLRVCALETERELVAATEAHKRWQQYALSCNHTLVGKSSHSICFYDYPALANWPRS
ncbi:hypothetical protein JKF63_02167 [Porcisia hertigi]|uniref:Uncharacterized protein n=1 Tax=Porcisia hertigi TaxID=2761500 RepID=A0A836HP27_9TRYP|nr:hypothetical protein JKF63_02167 [Porcisia hertigi]